MLKDDERATTIKETGNTQRRTSRFLVIIHQNLRPTKRRTLSFIFSLTGTEPNFLICLIISNPNESNLWMKEVSEFGRLALPQ